MLRIKKVTKEEADNIIETREPLGLFWLEDEGVFVGIDNSSGEVWTEDFKTKRKCHYWLKGGGNCTKSEMYGYIFPAKTTLCDNFDENGGSLI